MKNTVIKFFAIIFIAGLMASCTSIAGSGFDQIQQPKKLNKTTVNSDSSGINNVKTGQDEMDPIITPPKDMNDHAVGE